MGVATISPVELLHRHQSGQPCDLIDVRTPVEFRDTHVEFAHDIPLDKIDPRSVMEKRNGSAAQSLYLICQGGTRSRMACEKFEQAGYQNVVSVEGGHRFAKCQPANSPRKESDVA